VSEPTPAATSKWRAQVWNGERWVDGVLSTSRKVADDDAVRLARRYDRPVRVIEIEALS